MSAHNSGVPAGFCVTSAATITGEFVFYSGSGQNELRITPNGVKYRGEFLQDAGEVYRALNDVMNGKPLSAPVAPQAAPDLPARLNELDRMLANCRLTDRHPARQFLYAILLDVCGTSAAPVAQAVPVAEEWISVDQRLPPDETPVIILLDGVPRIGELRWEEPSYEETFKAFRYWDCPHDDGQGWEWHQVTAWMHLPPAPGSAK